MILDLDRGNSLLKWRLRMDSGEILTPRDDVPHEESMAWLRLQDDWSMEILLDAVQSAVQKYTEPLRRVRLVNVAGSKEEKRIQRWTEKHWHLSVEVAVVRARAAGVRNAYQNFSSLGADRWLAMLAARHLYPEQGICVVDCGSALTVDFLTPSGQHLGGYIAPGCRILSKSLERVLIPDHGGARDPQPILGSYLITEEEIHDTDAKKKADFSDVSPGRSTRQCLHASVPLMMAGLVEGAYHECSERFPELGQAIVLLSGGDRRVLIPHLDFDMLVQIPSLVLDGLPVLMP